MRRDLGKNMAQSEAVCWLLDVTALKSFWTFWTTLHHYVVKERYRYGLLNIVTEMLHFVCLPARQQTDTEWPCGHTMWHNTLVTQAVADMQPSHRPVSWQGFNTDISPCCWHNSKCVCVCVCVCLYMCFTSICHSALWVSGQTLSQLLPLLFCDVQPEKGQSLRDTCRKINRDRHKDEAGTHFYLLAQCHGSIT